MCVMSVHEHDQEAKGRPDLSPHESELAKSAKEGDPGPGPTQLGACHLPCSVGMALQLLLLIRELFCLGELRPLQPLHQLLDCLLDLLPFCICELATDLTIPQRVSDIVSIFIQRVPRVCLLHVLVVLKLVPPGILNHPLDLLLPQSPLVATDDKMVRLLGGLVLRRDVQDTISIDVEAYVYSRNTARGRRDAGEREFSEQVVVTCPCSLSFVDVNRNTLLIVNHSSVGLLLLHWNGGVSWNQYVHDSTTDLSAKGQRSDINNNEVRHRFNLLLLVFAQEGRLNCCTISDCLIWVDASAKLLTIEEILKQLLNLGDPCRSANQNDITDGVLGHSGVSQTILDGL
ncbi:NAD-specific glutamate dehydrogenase [Nymphaea thermarum]|nr:NAD-specific glutamate dehydrogenase [Nymphaea thermarum]